MTILSEIKRYGRFAWRLRDYLRHTISLEEAEAIVKRSIEERESNFLRVVKKGIFGYPKSPYLPLLKLADCQMGDIEDMVHREGLDKTLLALREAGVYVTFEEFKGREPIVRHGKTISVRAHDFDNPYLSHYYEGRSGGSTGPGTRVRIDLDHIASAAPHYMLAFDAHGMLNLPTAIWLGTLPDGSGFIPILRNGRFGNMPRKWFSTLTSRELRPSLKDRLATHFFVILGRLYGAPIPWPEPASLDQALKIARWVADTLRDQGPCLVITHVSRAMRVSIAARENGLDLTGATLMGGGEPPTPAKVREILKCGARWVPFYPFSEAGAVGMGCGHPLDGNDIHFFKDTLALIQSRRKVPGSNLTVDAFCFTTLLPTVPKLLLNVESDDYGLIETRRCGCPLERYGFTEHLRHTRSFRKLTGEGVTLVGSEMEQILEEVLPQRFGGSPLDYQLLEEEDENGFTRLSLLVSPEIKITDEAAVVGTVLEALGRGSGAADMARVTWNQAKTLRVKRMKPILTARGQVDAFTHKRTT